MRLIVALGCELHFPTIRRSRLGFAAATIFVLLFIGLLSWVFLVASKNPADSGESGILLLPFTMPWIALLPGEWVGPLAGGACVLINAFLIYLLFGGLSFRRSTAPGRKP